MYKNAEYSVLILSLMFYKIYHGGIQEALRATVANFGFNNFKR
jgi:hypothetical protein